MLITWIHSFGYNGPLRGNFLSWSFLFFGGHDKNNLTNKILQFLSKYNDLVYYIPASLKKNIKKSILKKNMIFFKSKYFYKYMHVSKIAIISGGMSLYDSIILKKNVICIPQYSHQTKNIKVNNLNKYLNYLYISDTSFKNKFLKIFNLLYYKKNIVNNYKLSLSNFIALFKSLNSPDK